MQIDQLLNGNPFLKEQNHPGFPRYLSMGINWENRLIGIKGARGTGKTHLLLRQLSELGRDASEATYLSLANPFFTLHSLSVVVAEFYKKGGKWLFLDDVHKYRDWSSAIKNIHSSYPDLHIVFAGSPVIDLGELSSPADLYELRGLSYREYLARLGVLEMKPISLESILGKDRSWKMEFPPGFRPLQYFDSYLAHGYYPKLVGHPGKLHDYLQRLVRFTVESDMAELAEFDIRNAKKMLQLYYILASQVPFKPNVSKLAEESAIHRNTINSYLQFLEQGGLARLLYPSGKNVASLQKPEKIYPDNTNLSYALAFRPPEKRSLHETFFVNQLSQAHSVRYPGKGDFIVDEKYVFEIGGKKKSSVQIRGTLNSFSVNDEEAYPEDGGIPLWVFGFLY